MSRSASNTGRVVWTGGGRASCKRSCAWLDKKSEEERTGFDGCHFGRALVCGTESRTNLVGGLGKGRTGARERISLGRMFSLVPAAGNEELRWKDSFSIAESDDFGFSGD